ncbi:hypothetical protein AUJ14_05180 [Candidatus Micrarchaeota archaeon CG1_02_55_22]|nr:MAG: hypothetical protein AUJ14_05180 [Candidatus Micrarchaeota archaeon CG1_02_55_22]
MNPRLPVQTFEVGLKLYCVKDGKLLTLVRPDGITDLPGGRINVGEETAPFQDILAREITEELGEDFKYELDGKEFVYIVKNREPPLLIVGLPGRQVGGEITLSGEHESFEWIDLTDERLKDHKHARGIEKLRKLV